MPNERHADVEFLKLQVEVWRESIASTKHFTEMSVKMRQLGLTFVVAAFALAITLLSQYPAARLSIPIWSWYYDIHLSGLVIIAAAIGLNVTRLLDVKVYHRMLRGSVAFTEELESKMLVRVLMGTDRGLAQTISHYSRTRTLAPNDNAQKIAKGTTAEQKIRAFYNSSIIFTILIGGAVTIFTTEMVERRSTVINQRIEINESADMPRTLKNE